MGFERHGCSLRYCRNALYEAKDEVRDYASLSGTLEGSDPGIAWSGVRYDGGDAEGMACRVEEDPPTVRRRLLDRFRRAEGDCRVLGNGEVIYRHLQVELFGDSTVGPVNGLMVGYTLDGEDYRGSAKGYKVVRLPDNLQPEKLLVEGTENFGISGVQGDCA